MDFNKEFKYLNDENHIYKEISLEDFKDLYYNHGTGLVIIGGPWDPKTQAIMKETDQIAKREGIKEILVYNPMFKDVFGDDVDLRDCLTLEQKLDYYFLVEHIGYKNEERELVQDTLIQKMGVPTFVAIRNGQTLKYYTSPYVKNPYIRLPDDPMDMTFEFDKKLTELLITLK